jgi:hypothetical protein
MARAAAALRLPRATVAYFLDILWDTRDMDEIQPPTDHALAEVGAALLHDDRPRAWARLESELDHIGPPLTYAGYLPPEEHTPLSMFDTSSNTRES